MEFLQVFALLAAIVLVAIISGTVGYQTGKMAWKCRGCHEEQQERLVIGDPSVLSHAPTIPLRPQRVIKLDARPENVNWLDAPDTILDASPLRPAPPQK